jgi:hypothetical protein
MPTRRVAAWIVGVVDPYGARWSRAITSVADAALWACLLRTLNTSMFGAVRPERCRWLEGPDARDTCKNDTGVDQCKVPQVARTGFCTTEVSSQVSGCVTVTILSIHPGQRQDDRTV